ncbi:MAG TPA: hypothetical protein DIC23_09720 [Planctomycetaceae bacterium]|nr:hypothetical protein [Planctomycetaceae bacterium]|tara:strand:+ start:200 stop:979 length:780 start_codon:yes stop_codon:yes gene_type:complete
MNTFDFNRSFFTFRIDTLVKQPLTVTHKPPFSLNNARIPIECRCVVTEKATDQAQSFVLGASCKTERVGVESDIWLEPNADFCPIFSDDRYLSLKTYSQVGTTMDLFPPGSGSQSDRQTGLIDDTYDSVKIDMTECDGTPLDSAQEIVEAVLANQNLVARTELENDRYHALIEHPVKTINANERDWIYQTDTGPVLFPDLSVEPGEMLTSLELAYSAFNCPDWIEFIVRRVTPTTSDVSVYHYSDAVRCDSRNQMLRID